MLARWILCEMSDLLATTMNNYAGRTHQITSAVVTLFLRFKTIFLKFRKSESESRFGSTTPIIP